MPITEAAIGAALFDRCLAVLGRIREGKKERNKRTDQALFALHTALIETKAYAERLNAGKRRNRKSEYAIAKLWHDASVPLRYIDPDLADRCFLKGSYWMDRDVWTSTMVKQRRIQLDQVLDSTRKILLKG